MVALALNILRCVGLTAVAQSVPTPGDQPPAGIASTTAQPDDSGARIGELISALGEPAYARRNEAMRELLRIGPAALDALREAAKTQSFEVATRAGHAADLVASLMFTGVEVEVSVSNARIDWNEPADLTLTLTNRSNNDARVPFDLDGPAAATAGAGEDEEALRRLAVMLDVSEYVTVASPDGRRLEARMDDVTSEGAARAVIEARVDGGPVSVLRPGQKAAVILREFNRGWARFPLLDSGAYTLEFKYEPDWPDDAFFDGLRSSGAWVVSARPVTLTVANPAPPEVSRRGRPARLDLAQDQEGWACRLVCTYDLPVWVNVNFGEVTPFASLKWEAEDEAGKLSVTLSGVAPRPMKLSEFDPARLVRVEPGQSIELMRLTADRLNQAIREAGGQPDAGWTLQADYLSLFDRFWQQRERGAAGEASDAPVVLTTPLPRSLLTLHLTSPSVQLPRR